MTQAVEAQRRVLNCSMSSYDVPTRSSESVGTLGIKGFPWSRNKAVPAGLSLDESERESSAIVMHEMG